MARPPLPPYTHETAVQKVRLAEDAWNTRDPARVSGHRSGKTPPAPVATAWGPDGRLGFCGEFAALETFARSMQQCRRRRSAWVRPLTGSAALLPVLTARAIPVPATASDHGHEGARTEGRPLVLNTRSRQVDQSGDVFTVWEPHSGAITRAGPALGRAHGAASMSARRTRTGNGPVC